MTDNPFFERPIVNSPYAQPRQHWELDETGQPTGRLLDRRRRAEFITPIPKPKKRRGSKQQESVLDEDKGVSTKSQTYDLTSVINEVRNQADTWRRTVMTRLADCCRDNRASSSATAAPECTRGVRGKRMAP